MKAYTYFIFLLFLFRGYAQTYTKTHPVYHSLTYKEGLPDTQFYGIIEDKKGYIWLAANNGLFRYDGLTFKLYSHPKKRGMSVFCLKLDPKGRIWCSNLTGQIFYVEKDSLQLFADLKKYTVNELPQFFFSKKELIVYDEYSIIRLDTKNKRIHTIDTLENNYKVAYQENKKLYCFNRTKIGILDQKNKAVSPIPLKKIPVKHLQHKWKYSLVNKLKTEEGLDLLINEKLFRIFKGSLHSRQEPITFKALKGNINFFIEKNTLWQCTSKGIKIFEYKNNSFIKKGTYFEEYYITDILKDRSGNYWIATLDNGIFILPNIAIEQLMLPPENKNITAMNKEGSNILVVGSSKNTLFKINTKTKETTTITLPYESAILSIANDNNNTYVSQNNISFVFNRGNKALVKNNFIKELKLKNAKDISILNDSSLVYTSAYYTGLKKGNTYRVLKEERSFTSHYSVSENKIYVGSLSGLFVYDKNFREKEIKYKKEYIFAKDIDETTNGMIWVATYNDGVIGIKNDRVLYNYTKESGLLSNQCHIIKGDNMFLWIATNKGIQCLNTQTGAIKSLTEKEGLSPQNITAITFFKETVFVSSNNGIVTFNKHKVFKKKPSIFMHLTKVLVEDMEVPLNERYVLQPTEDKIQFNFHVNGYLTSENLKYYYKLNDTEDSWNAFANKSSQIVFNNLSPNDYSVKIKAVDLNGQETFLPNTINIEVKAPFYKRTGVILIATAIVIGFFWLYFYRRIRAVKAKQKETLHKERIKRDLIALQLENLRSQMNPHFIFNALNSIQEYVVFNEKKLASEYLIRFSRLIRLFLEHSQKQYISLSEEIIALKLYLELEKDRFEDSFDFYIHIGEGIDTGALQVPTVFIQPYVENAIKHGLLHKKTNQKLWLTFLKDTNNLTCIIEDNGIGREASYKIKENSNPNHKSFAMNANQKRIHLINSHREQKIEIVVNDLYENDKPLGTKVVLTIPIKPFKNSIKNL